MYLMTSQISFLPYARTVLAPFKFDDLNLDFVPHNGFLYSIFAYDGSISLNTLQSCHTVFHCADLRLWLNDQVDCLVPPRCYSGVVHTAGVRNRKNDT